MFNREQVPVAADPTMSTPISAIPDDVDMPDMDDVDDDLFPSDAPFVDSPAPVMRQTYQKQSKHGRQSYLVKYQDYIILLVSSAIALKIPLESIRKHAPPQLFAMGDIPVRALIVLVSYIVAQQLVKNLLQ